MSETAARQATAVDQTVETTAGSHPGQAQKSKWARQVPGNGSNATRNLFSAMNRKWVHVSYVLIDLLLICLSGAGAFFFRFASAGVSLHHQFGSGLVTEAPIKPHLGFLLVYAILILLFFQSEDLYRTPRGKNVSEETWEVFRSVGLATVVLVAFIFCMNVKIVSREVVAICAGANIVLLASWRFWKRQFVIRRVEQGLATRNALIVGAGATGRELARQLEENKQLGYRFAGFLDPQSHSSSVMLGKIEDLAQIARAKFIDEVFVTMSLDREVVNSVANEAKRLHLNVKVVPELCDGLVWTAPARFIGSLPVLELHRETIPSFGLFIKRLVDIIVSGVALVVLSPLFALLTIAIRLDSPGAVFYRANRIGRKGVPFVCYKFRSMIRDAEKHKEELHHLNERSNGLLFKIEGDPRITRMGRFLRRYSLDELPQFWNVLKGEMSLVGPRPALPTEFERYSLEHFRRLDVKPGLTGMWQVTARLDPSFDHYIDLDLQYIEHWSLWLDLKILAKTIPEVLRASGR